MDNALRHGRVRAVFARRRVCLAHWSSTNTLVSTKLRVESWPTSTIAGSPATLPQPFSDAAVRACRSETLATMCPCRFEMLVALVRRMYQRSTRLVMGLTGRRRATCRPLCQILHRARLTTATIPCFYVKTTQSRCNRPTAYQKAPKIWLCFGWPALDCAMMARIGINLRELRHPDSHDLQESLLGCHTPYRGICYANLETAEESVMSTSIHAV